MSGEVGLNMFAERINALTRPCPTIGVIRLFIKGQLIRVLVNTPGQSAALRVIANFQFNNKLTRSEIELCLNVFSPLLSEARATPGIHPTIDLLLGLGDGQELEVQVVETLPELFTRIQSGVASIDEKQAAVELLDKGSVRCAEKIMLYEIRESGVVLTGDGVWVTQPHGIACMNACFSAFPMKEMGLGFYDKVPLKTEGWSHADFELAGVRFIPGSFVRRGAYVGAGTTVMPGGIVNVGAYVAGAGVMIDGGARVATGAQVGRGVKLGAGSGIEGILEPAGRLPTIVEDNVRIGANCELVGIIEEGAVIASGVVMGSGKKIYDLRTNAVLEPRYMAIGDKLVTIPYIPKGRVAVGGTYSRTKDISVDCIVLLEKEASETSLAQLPRNAALYAKI